MNFPFSWSKFQLAPGDDKGSKIFQRDLLVTFLYICNQLKSVQLGNFLKYHGLCLNYHCQFFHCSIEKKKSTLNMANPTWPKSMMFPKIHNWTVKAPTKHVGHSKFFPHFYLLMQLQLSFFFLSSLFFSCSSISLAILLANNIVLISP